MVEIEDNIRRSDGMQEMIGKTPSWIVRTGSVLMFIWLIILFGLAMWIRYPEVLEGTITITTATPPAELVSKANGRINFLVVNDQNVKKDEIIAFVKNSASFSEIIQLNSLVDKLQRTRLDPMTIVSLSDSIPNLANLGKVQSAFNAFVRDVGTYTVRHELNKHQVMVSHHLEQVSTLQAKEKLLMEKENVLQQELTLAEDNFSADRSLFERDLISKTEFDQSHSNLLLARRNFQSNKQLIIENRQNLQRLRSDVSELNLDDVEQKSSLVVDVKNSFNILVAELKAYKDEFIITSPIEGNVSFFDFWNNNQYVRIGERVAYIVVSSENILGKLLVKNNKFGKVKIGQRVRIKLNSYPMSEYGMLIGTVNNISKVNRENLYSVDVALSRSLVTTYHRTIPYSDEMKGIGEIVTEDLNLLQRILYSLRAIGKKEYTEEKNTPKR